MSKYIEADAVEKAICKRVYAVEVEDILAEIANAPTIDIVRCKECKRANHELSGIYCGLSDVNMGEDGYCSYGERRTDG